MFSDEKPSNKEREQTDESLRVEREKADQALRDELAAIDETADAVIFLARARADAVVAAARATIDRQSLAPRSSPQLVARDRAREDAALQAERADADATVRAERADHIAQLSVDRKETDKDLLSERVRSDGAIATRDELLGVVGHDLRNMLNAIVGFAALIADEVKQDDHVDRVITHAKRISRSGARMNRLVGDLVDVASIEAGVLAVSRELADPAHVAREAIDTLHATAAASGVQLFMQSTPAPALLVELDPARILQVLINLLSNAIKFTARGGRVQVSVERSAGDVRVVVRDTGTGIAADKLELIFERFRQIVSKDRRGVGLGLYISKCIVQGHGGRIWAESEPGKGSTFCFTLPRIASSPA